MSTQERTPSLTTVDICYIHIHPDIQVRTMVSDDALERYTEIYQSGNGSLPPIKICISSETQEFFLIDGHHRLNAARAAGLKTIPALDFGEMTLAEMISESIRSNCEQGLALSKADRKRAVEMLAKYNPQITVRDAAQRVGLSKSLVATVLKEYREKTVVQCNECKATVLRLYAEDSTNGWVQVPETKRDRWFCCEDHRREFYAKQAEKEAERQAKREALEEERNAELEDETETVSETKTENVSTPQNINVPESQRDYDPKPSSDPHFNLQPCFKCGSKAYYHSNLNFHEVCCSNEQCDISNYSSSKDQSLYDWNTLYNVNQERDQHQLCPFCGSKPEMHITSFKERKFYVTCERNSCCFPEESPSETFPQDAWKHWDEAASLQASKAPVTKPCPFCGDIPTVHELQVGPWQVSCQNMDCPIGPESDFFETSEEAIKAWNNRPGIEVGAEPETPKMFSKLLLKFLRLGYMWVTPTHDVTVRLIKYPGEERLIIYVQTKDGQAISGSYVLPNLLEIEFPQNPREVEE